MGWTFTRLIYPTFKTHICEFSGVIKPARHLIFERPSLHIELLKTSFAPTEVIQGGGEINQLTNQGTFLLLSCL